MPDIINIHQAKTHLSRLIAQVEQGKEIIIGKAGKPVAKLTGYHEPTFVRKPGALKGKIWMSDDFDILPPDIEKLFYEGPIFPPEKTAKKKSL